MQPYCSTDTAIAWNDFCFVLSELSDIHMFDNLSIVVHALLLRMLILISVD